MAWKGFPQSSTASGGRIMARSIFITSSVIRSGSKVCDYKMGLVYTRASASSKAARQPLQLTFPFFLLHLTRPSKGDSRTSCPQAAVSSGNLLSGRSRSKTPFSFLVIAFRLGLGGVVWLQ